MAFSFFRRLLPRTKMGNGEGGQADTPPGDAEALYLQGVKFAMGEDVVRSYREAADCYLKAATQGHSAAQFNLGLMYWQGQGVPRNEATALLWLRKAADQGHAEAQYHVGLRRHRAGKSSPEPEASECRVEAFKWLQLATAQGHHESRKAREFLALDMTREEVAEGGRRAKAYKKAAPALVGER